MWFQTEMAMAHRRLEQLGEALVKFHEIDKVGTSSTILTRSSSSSLYHLAKMCSISLTSSMISLTFTHTASEGPLLEHTWSKMASLFFSFSLSLTYSLSLPPPFSPPPPLPSLSLCLLTVPTTTVVHFLSLQCSSFGGSSSETSILCQGC